MENNNMNHYWKSEPMTTEKLAELMAKRIGHGMTEKCMIHAQLAIDIFCEQVEYTATRCITLAERRGKNAEGMGTPYPEGYSDAARHIVEAIREEFELPKLEKNGMPKSPLDTLEESNADVLARLVKDAGHKELPCGCVEDKHGKIFIMKCGGH